MGVRGWGMGTQIFHRQVEQASQFGFKSIETYADGNPGDRQSVNGYYTWARLGYDADLSDLDSRVFDEVGDYFPEAERISDLMKTAEGRSFWKSNGGRFKGTFDLKEGSQSRKVLDDYVKAKS
jgi:hypothetical protein